MMTVKEAREQRVCRVCGVPILGGKGSLLGWESEFGERLYPPPALTLNFGDEFAHTTCLGAKNVNEDKGEPRQLPINSAPPKFRAPTDQELQNRFMHHPPHGDQAARYNRIRNECLTLAIIIRDLTPVSPEQTRAINAIDEAMMLANAAIARNEPMPLPVTHPDTAPKV